MSITVHTYSTAYQAPVRTVRLLRVVIDHGTEATMEDAGELNAKRYRQSDTEYQRAGGGFRVIRKQIPHH